MTPLPPCWACTNAAGPRGKYPELDISADGQSMTAVYVTCDFCNGTGFSESREDLRKREEMGNLSDG